MNTPQENVSHQDQSLGGVTSSLSICRTSGKRDKGGKTTRPNRIQVSIRRRNWLQRRARKAQRRRKRKALAERAKNFIQHVSRQRPAVARLEAHLAWVRQTFLADSKLTYHKKSRSYYVKMPSHFSFANNIEEAMNCIHSLLSIPPNRKTSVRARKIFIDQTACRKIGLAATAVFDVCAMMIRDEQKLKQKKGYHFAGAFPIDLNVANQVKVMGITKHLNIANTKAPKDFEAKIIQLPLQRGRKRADDWKGKNDQEIVSTRLAQHLNNCFETASEYTLTDEATAQLVKWSGEIITNAEEHSGVNEWYAMACMMPCEANAGAVIGECELVIFGFGKSIYQTLSSNTTCAKLRSDIESLVNTHTQAGYFSHSAYTPESLWTLYALQEGVSSLSSEENRDRGTGTVRLIEAFQKLGQTLDEDKKPQMLLLSGSTQIQFDGKYRMQPHHVDGGIRNIIAFNKTNSLKDKPDAACVKQIKGFFPGTLLSFKFYVDGRFLSSLTQDHNKEP